MKKAIITGATGVVGTALINKLISENVKVLVLVRKGGRNDNIPKNPLVRVENCALEEMKDFKNLRREKYDVLFHLGWSGTSGKIRDDATIQESNIKYTLDAVKLASRFGCSVFVGAGSQAENGILAYGEKVSPRTQENPVSGYGIAKLAAGRLSRMLCNELNIRHEWCRILSAYGPYCDNDSLISVCVKKFLKNEECDFTKGEQQWDFIYSKDVANAFYLIAEKGKADAVYTLGSGETRYLRDYIKKVHDIVGCDSKCNFGAVEYYPNQVMYLCADISELKKDTGFKVETSFEQGVKETVEWYRNEEKK